MSTPEERAEWRRLARFVSQLGLTDGEELPADRVEELANATLALLDERGEREQRAAMLRRLDRLTAELKRVQEQRNALAMKLAASRGTAWEDELEAVGVEPHTARDSRPSEAVPLDSLPSFAERLADEDEDRVRRGPFRPSRPE